MSIALAWAKIDAPLLSLSAQLPDSDMERCMLRHYGPARDQAIAARILLRKLLVPRLGTDSWTSPIIYTETGQPKILAPIPLDISLSHTKNRVAAAYSIIGPLGVDIETADTLPDQISLLPFVKRFFADEEFQKINALPIELQRQDVLTLWTAKEALAKASGNGLELPALKTAISRTVRSWNLLPDTSLSLALVQENIHDLSTITPIPFHSL